MPRKELKNVYTPNLEIGDVIKIHPSIDFKDGKGYFGVWFPSKEDKEDKLFLMTSNREILSTQMGVLEQKDLKIYHEGIKFLETQWSSRSIKDFTEQKINSRCISLKPKEVFDEIKYTFEYFMELPENVAEFLSLWVIGTYLFPLFNAYPYVFVWGIKRTGKSKLLTATSLMSFNSVFSANTSSSSIFRLIQQGRCSLFMDESEKLINKDRSEDIRSILLSGYKKGAKVQRTEKNPKGNFEVFSFEVYSPKMIANIHGLEDIMEDRCIKITMKRTLDKEICNRDPNENNPKWQEIRDSLYVFALQNFELIEENYENLPNKTILNSRNWELWKPIFAIALFIDKKLYEKMIVFAEENVKEKDVENITESLECVLVQVLIEIVEENPNYYKVKEITEKMKAKFDDEQRWLNTIYVGRALGRLGFKEKRRVGTGVEYKLNTELG